MSATVDVRELTWVAEHTLQFVVTCRHGQSVTIIAPSRRPKPMPKKLRVALVAHDRELGCACTGRLWERAERRRA